MRYILFTFFVLTIIMGCKEKDHDIRDLERMANDDAVNLFHENKLDYHYDSH